MKQIIFVVQIMTALFSNQALAYLPIEESPVRYSAQILNSEINHSFIKNTKGGTLLVDLKTEKITLLLNRPWTCPEGMACAAVMPAPEVIQLPIINIYTDWCGSTVYEAQVNNMPADGLLETIKVIDYSEIKCKILVPYMTKIEYTSLNPWNNETTQSIFNAEELVLDYVLM